LINRLFYCINLNLITAKHRNSIRATLILYKKFKNVGWMRFFNAALDKLIQPTRYYTVILIKNHCEKFIRPKHSFVGCMKSKNSSPTQPNSSGNNDP